MGGHYDYEIATHRRERGKGALRRKKKKHAGGQNLNYPIKTDPFAAALSGVAIPVNVGGYKEIQQQQVKTKGGVLKPLKKLWDKVQAAAGAAGAVDGDGGGRSTLWVLGSLLWLWIESRFR